MATAVDQDQARQLLRDAPLPLIAARIRRARRDLGLSHDTLGQKMGGVSRQHLIKLEKGRHRPGIEMLLRLSDALGKPFDFFLVEGSGEPNPFPAEAA